MDTGTRKIIAAVYSNEKDAKAGVKKLKQTGFDTRQVSLITNKTEVVDKMQDDMGVSRSKAAGAGVVSGASIGALGGLVIGIGSLAIPGIGTLIIGGPFATALGLIGSSTATGAAAGAVGGGTLGLLTKAGLDKDVAENYAKQISLGEVLVLVPVTAKNEGMVHQVLADTEADHVKGARFTGSDSIWNRMVRA